ncbi:MAG: glucuronate isomerase [Christensenellales bacterium]|nr:glucuronate isomerase [Clostridiales bacterium]
MKKFMSEIFLENEMAKKLYQKVKDLPIYDFHCHLNPKEIYEDKRYKNLTEIWLLGDHYKWRIMRAFGISEDKVTGDASHYEKFRAFCKALPYFMGNPVYHFAHLELKKYFDLDIPICEENADAIWEKTSQYMQDNVVSPRSLLKVSGVSTLITTDDPLDDLKYHDLLLGEKLECRVLPCFRPDKIINIQNVDFKEYIEKLSKVTEITIDDFNSLMEATKKRIEYFLARNCLCADLSFLDFPKGKGDFYLADSIFKRKINNEIISTEEAEEYMFCIVTRLAKIFAENDMVMQLHVGPMRNCSSTLYNQVGVDAGGDSIGNTLDIEKARNMLDYIDQNGGLPKTIIFTLNPNAYYPLATLLGSFQGNGKRGKMQLGAAWWFLDHKDGIYEQLKINASTGGLGLFVGMLTDSRSFASYARHDYFRRILCSLIGSWIEKGEYSAGSDEKLVEILEKICYYNAKEYFDKKRGVV